MIVNQLEGNEYLKFYKKLREAKDCNSHGCFVVMQMPEYYATTQNFLLDDGIAGFAIDNGNLTAIFKNPMLATNKNFESVIQELMLVALSFGANKLDCYGEYLAEVYAKYGFLPVAKMKFNLEYNPTWNTEKFGYPDVIVMAKGVANIQELFSRQINDNLYTYSSFKDSLPIFNDYVEMLKYRDLLMEHNFVGKTFEDIAKIIKNQNGERINIEYDNRF